MSAFLHDAVLVGAVPLLAVWARWYFNVVGQAIRERRNRAVIVAPVRSRLAQTVADVGWGRHTGGTMFQHARWQVGS